MAYLLLALAIVTEVIGTISLKLSYGLTKLLPSITVIVFYVLSFYFLSLVIKVFPVGVTYGIWSGVGILLITLGGVVFFREIPDLAAILGLSFIVAGVIIIQVFSKSLHH